ncbi:MAG: glycosyltransferase N-terminal domain-containing protein [Candidatus Babeliales bacterium]|jgi:3-deoxy-D-manno-octulosonic-acid transferase|nr:MAG: Three-deoxy-D-manno-octulosonic-acid transferase domain protein [candidate division TM6 bacterium GW2011_GWF2_36_6]
MLAIILIFLIYNLLQILILPFFLAYLLYRKFSGKKIFGSFKHRIGLVEQTSAQKKSNTKTIWIHAVSVGEVLSVQHFISQLKKQKPDTIIYLTVGTPAGKEVAQKNIAADVISFMPYDFLPFMLLAFWRIRPSKIFIIEAEIWPNMLILANLFRIKKYLINARVSARSYGRYKFLKFIFAPLFNSFEKIYAQSQQDKHRFITLNVNQEKIDVLGDIKIFNVYQKWQAQVNIQEHREHEILLVGSIHPGELDFYVKLYQALKPSHPNLKMILAPRHFHWIQELESKIKNAGLSYFMWTAQNDIRNATNISQSQSLDHAITQIFESHNLLLVCKLGELFNLYKFANIFYLGGTFVNIGGHNLLEPAVWKNACIIGPHHQNTQVVASQMEKIGGLIPVNNFEQLLQASQRLLDDHDLIKQMGQRNFEWILQESKPVEVAIQEIIKNI